MKLLFIENRYKTYTFEAIAKYLEKEGHTVAFLIQNAHYKPKSNLHCFSISFPKKTDLNKNYPKNKAIERVIESDRAQNFFKKKGVNYFYYYSEKILNILDTYKPDLVFGESTAFHELLTINNCKDRNILYLNPSSCRYPKKRFSFYKYNTLEPYKGSGNGLSNTEALTIINSIISRSEKPDYMKIIKTDQSKKIKDKLVKVSSFLKGDSYNTPNPIVKYKIEKQKERNITNWDAFAKKKIETKNKTIVLYPLQMQPEANIDVWGQKHRDQLQVIKSISKALPDNALLIVKPNPKSKYELSKELIDFVKNTNNVIGIHHAVKMDDIIAQLDLVVTVTGTIAIECILSNIPVVTLVKTLNNNQSNCKYIENIQSELPKIISDVKSSNFPKINESEKIEYINHLNKTSYKGRFSDPFSFAGCLLDENLDQILKAFTDVLNNKV